MKEIKFRGKKVDNGDWFYGYYVKSDCGYEGIEHIIQGPDNYYDVEPGTVGQFTGLHDKNGKEIYEGDVHKDEENMLWVVIFDNGCFKLENIHIPGRMFITKDIEVTGNIYDNPELLEGGQ